MSEDIFSEKEVKNIIVGTVRGAGGPIDEDTVVDIVREVGAVFIAGVAAEMVIDGEMWVFRNEDGELGFKLPESPEQ